MRKKSYNIMMAACLAMIYIPYLMSYWFDVLSSYTGFVFTTVSFIAFVSLVFLREILRRRGVFEEDSNG
ncbi:hypothetical protein TALC_00259 [Thermoplasmatales archaeon BRNA1]|nr:hypothetical protein TALC_00259 [Thermoplasmatales archaeon BRNA1]